MNLFKFPYKEKSLDGVFGFGVRTQNFHIKYEVVLSSEFTIPFPAENCFDGNLSSFCHTDSSETGPQYLQIHFSDVKFKIEGFAIQNRHDGRWNPLNYVIQGSNDGINFAVLGSFNEISSEVCNPGATRTRRISTNLWFSYFRLRTTGMACGWYEGHPSNKYNLNIAEFDLFGCINNYCLYTPMQKQFVFYQPFEWFILLIYS
jgi:hypothetical protein